MKKFPPPNIWGIFFIQSQKKGLPNIDLSDNLFCILYLSGLTLYIFMSSIVITLSGDS